MKQYINNLQENKTPHQRRQYAMRVAGLMTAVLFVGWIATLGVRLSQSAVTAQNSISNTASTIISVGATSTQGY